MSYKYSLPKKGETAQNILKHIEDFKKKEPDRNKAYMGAYCMVGSPEIQELMEQAYQRYFFENALVRRYFPGLRQMEDDIKEIAAGILSGGTEGIKVNITSGGTESLFCAMHAAREWARDKFPHIKEPEFIGPYSAHATITKSCHYLGMKLKRVPVGADFRADAKAMEAAIGPNTIGLLGSAPSWPYGKVDPMADIAAVGQKHGLWVHVDACVGGYFAPWAKRLGYKFPDWDFSVPGVISISADLHKYGYAPKPISTIAWRSEEYQKYHGVYPTEWPSQQYIAEGLVGSRSGGVLAAAWAVLHYLGEDGYMDYTRRTMDTKKKLTDGLIKLGMKPLDTDLCLILYESPEFPAEAVVGAMTQRGWTCMGTQRPPLIQLVLDPMAERIADNYLSELAEVIKELRAGKQGKKGELGYAD
ncbi:MAG: aminotransferase class V-fold PLP-dependent enzyme [Sphingomonadales bacterium]|nr:aminotransferase class V-fold PLP-dependent enzyme [Sphingomonadales bacterium]